MADHDRGYKLLFSHPRMVLDLLRGFVPGSWVSQLDFASLERESGDLVSDDLHERRNDVIWRLRWADGRRQGWFYLLLEFQSSPQPFMALRLVVYAGPAAPEPDPHPPPQGVPGSSGGAPRRPL